MFSLPPSPPPIFKNKIFKWFFVLFIYLFACYWAGMWDLSSLTRDWTHASTLEGRVLITVPPGKSPFNSKSTLCSCCCYVTSVVSASVRPHRRQLTTLPGPWDSSGKNTRVGCHFLLQCVKVKSESEVAQSCPTPSDPMGCSPPGSSVHGIFQARVLEWGAIAFSTTLC